ncbi:MAG TPA: L-threonylcarbamoyladenylate synthase [Phycisphaerae bacterium]|nr:L-threonylcarbamoyladenylate synthase [Phycisphaerae bacterium]
MTTRLLKVDPLAPDPNIVREAAQCLSDGGLVILPTETVYGLAAHVTNSKALARLRAVKGREATKPFTVHIGSRTEVERFVPGLEGLGRRLVRKAWPGPLTIIFPVPDPGQAAVVRETSLSHVASLYHEGTIGIRCPEDDVASAVLTAAKVPVVAASANPAGAPPPVTADEALATLDGQADIALDAGRTRYAKPSTIVKIDGGRADILREGLLDERTIRRLCRLNFLVVCTGNTCRSPMAEGLLRHLLAEKLGCDEEALADRGYHVESAGVGGGGGMPASDEAVTVLGRRGIKLARHRSSPLTLDAIRRADFILTMTAGHLRAVQVMAPAATDRSQILDAEDIEDPIGGDEDEYARCADRIEKALRRRLEEISL